MKILITGALNLSCDFHKEIESMGFEVTYVKNEREVINIDEEKFVGVICNSFFMYNDIKKFKNLKFIQLTSAGLDRVPVDEASKMGVKIFNAKNVYNIPIAEFVVLKILEIYKQSYFFYKNKTNKQWKKSRTLEEIYGKTVCIVGYGNIGKEVAHRLESFGARILVVGKKNPLEKNRIFYPNSDIKNALKISDIVVLSLPLTKETKYMINDEMISSFKKNSVLINVSRGQIIDEKALIKYLQNNHLLAASLDVFEEEPLDIDSPLWELKNVMITPHNAFYSKQNILRLQKVILDNLSVQSEELK